MIEYSSGLGDDNFQIALISLDIFCVDSSTYTHQTSYFFD